MEDLRLSTLIGISNSLYGKFNQWCSAGGTVEGVNGVFDQYAFTLPMQSPESYGFSARQKAAIAKDMGPHFGLLCSEIAGSTYEGYLQAAGFADAADAIAQCQTLMAYEPDEALPGKQGNLVEQNIRCTRETVELGEQLLSTETGEPWYVMVKVAKLVADKVAQAAATMRKV